MSFIDTYTEERYTLADMFTEWTVFRSEDPDNHADNFTAELFEILMATINGRNDLDIVGLTPREVGNYIIKLRKVVI